MPTTSPTRHRRQHGFTLIELMVAITITLAVTAGIASIFANFKSSYLLQDKQAQVQDTQRLLLTMVTNTVQSAGYFVDPVSDTAKTALPETSLFEAGTSIVGTATEDGDTMKVRYQTAPGDGIMNCLGAANTTPDKKVWTNSFGVNEKHELTCSVNDEPSVALVGGVSKLAVQYGVDTNEDGSVDQYLNATAVAAAKRWKQIRSVQMTVTFLAAGDKAFEKSAELPAWTQTIAVMNQL